MKKLRWILLWGLLFSLLIADDYRTITRQSNVDIQKFKRVALVIGNDNYESGKLSNSVNDARAMRDFLKSKDFKVVYVENATEKVMRKKVNFFLKSLDKKSVGFVYYAGHGIQEFSQKYKKTMNYLVPIDNNKLESITDLDYSTVSLNYILDSLSEKNNGFNIVLLDACRTPFKSFSKSVQDGLAPSNAQGVYIAYATASGDKALDNSLFRKSFIKNAKEPLKLIDILENVKLDIYNKTGQTPFISNGKIGSFYFTKIDTQIESSNSNIIQISSKELDMCRYLSLEEKDFHEVMYHRAIKACQKVQGVIAKGYVAKNLQRLNKYDEAKQVFKKINPKLQKKCMENEDKDACYLASFYFYNVLKEWGKGIRFLEKSSNLGNKISIYVLGKMYQGGRGVVKDEAKALTLYKKSCDLKFDNACITLGRFYERKKDINLALKTYAKSCERGHSSSCFYIGNFYENHYKDYTTAIKFYKKSCQSFRENSCHSLINMYIQGYGVKKDLNKAKEIFTKTCKARNINKNTCVGLMYSQGKYFPKDNNKAIDFYKKGCDSDDKIGCHSLALKYSEDKGAKKNIQKSIYFYKKACNLKDAYSCKSLAKLYLDRGNIIQSNKFYKKACSLGNKGSCEKVE